MKTRVSLSGSGTMMPSSQPQYQTNAALNANNPSWFNAQQGTFIIEYDDTLSNNSTEIVFSMTDGSTSNRIEWLHGAYISDGRALQVSEVSGTRLIDHAIQKDARVSGRCRLAIAYKDGSLVYYWNGIPIARNTSYTLPAFSHIGIGSRAHGGLDFSGSIVSVRYYADYKPDWFLRMQTNGLVPSINTDYQDDLNIVFFGGQSNASGRASDNVSLIHSDLKMIGNDGALKTYSDAYDDATDALFPALSDITAAGSYAGKVIDELKTSQGAEWACASANLGGTPVIGTVNGWAYDFTNGSIGERKTSTLTYASYQQGLIAKRHGRIKALVWHQGESDALNETSETDFKEATQKLLHFYHVRFGCPIIVVGLHKWYDSAGMGTASNWNTLRLWQEELAGSLSYATFVDLQDIDGDSADRIHLDRTGNGIAGGRIAAAINAL